MNPFWIAAALVKIGVDAISFPKDRSIFVTEEQYISIKEKISSGELKVVSGINECKNDVSLSLNMIMKCSEAKNLDGTILEGKDGTKIRFTKVENIDELD